MTEVSRRDRSDGKLSKTKRNKYESMKVTVGSYLKRRHYSEVEVHNKLVSQEQMALSLLIEKESARPNSILYSCINSDPVQIEHSFSKFFSWTKNITGEPMVSELTKIISPLFSHLYLEMLRGGHPQPSSLFFLNHRSQIQNDSKEVTSLKIFEALPNIKKSEDIENDQTIMSFRSCKFRMALSQETLALLKDFLAKHSHVVLLQVFQTWFDFEIKPVEAEDEAAGTAATHDEEEIVNGHAEIEEIDELADLRQTVETLNAKPPPLLLINAKNGQNTATCGEINFESAKIAVGFTTSEIRLWGLGNLGMQCSTVNIAPTRVSLACDSSIPAEDVNFARTFKEPMILRSHTDGVHAVKFVPGTDILMSVSKDCTMRAWDLTNFSCAAVYRGHNYPVWCMDVSSLGMYVATGSYDRTVRVWTVDRTCPLRICAGHTLDVSSLHFHPNASYIASGSADKTVRIWSVSEGKSVRLLIGHKGVVYSVAFSPDGQYLASGGEDKKIKIWEVTSAKQVSELRGCLECVTSLHWSPDGRFLSAGSLDGCVRLWEAKSITKEAAEGANHNPFASYMMDYTSVLSVQCSPKWLACLTSSYFV